MTVIHNDRVLRGSSKKGQVLNDQELAFYANQNLLHLVSKKWMSLTHPEKDRNDLDVILAP